MALAHPLLHDILNEPRLSSFTTPDTNPSVSLVLLPPPDTLPSSPQRLSFDFLASHVVPLSVHLALPNKPLPRTSLSSSSVLSRITSPRSHRLTATAKTLPASTSLLSLGSIRSRSRSNSNVSISPDDRHTHATFNGKPLSLGSNIIRTAGPRLINIVYNDILYDANDRIAHLLFFLDQPLWPSNDAHAVADDAHLSDQEEMLRFKELELKSDICLSDMLSETSTLNRRIQHFCDDIIEEDNIVVLSTRMKQLIDESYAYADEKSTSLDDSLYGLVENYVMEHAYDVVFYKVTQCMASLDSEVSQILESMKELDFVQVDLPNNARGRQRVKNAAATLNRIGTFRTPAEKLDCLFDTFTELSKPIETQQDHGSVDSDDLISYLLLALVQCRTPHLMANLTYMKEFTFETNIVTGKYGFALSTLEGILQYILESRNHLGALARQNRQFWSALDTGNPSLLNWVFTHDIVSSPEASRRSSAATLHVTFSQTTAKRLCAMKDEHGNNALLKVCMAGQVDMAEFLLGVTGGSTPEDINDQQYTPLMCAIQSASLPTVLCLLKHDPLSLQNINTARDECGNTALMLACHSDLTLLDTLVQHGASVCTHNDAGDGPLHHDIALNVFVYLLEKLPASERQRQNNQGDTFLHRIGNPDILKACLNHASITDELWEQVNHLGQTPLQRWAARGRLDLIYILLTSQSPKINVDVLDNNGQSALHLMADSLSRGLTVDPNYLPTIIGRFKRVANVHDRLRGDTCLHIAMNNMLSIVENHQRRMAYSFIQCVILNAGVSIHRLNWSGERAAHLCQSRDTLEKLDDIALQAKLSVASFRKWSLDHYTWTVTRAIVGWDGRNPTVCYIVYSRSPGTDNDPVSVQRSLDDFILLRQELLNECPEAFLPTLRHLIDPASVDIYPPPTALLEETIRRLDQFMNYILFHPVLCHHEMVLAFVRSVELNRQVISNGAFARRKLLMERISDLYPSNDDAQDEIPFFSFTQSTLVPLRNSLLEFVQTGRKVALCRRGLCEEMNQVARKYMALLPAKDPIPSSTLEIIRLCTLLTEDTITGGTDWRDWVQEFQSMHDLVDGILMALQRPFWLLHREKELRTDLEQQRDALRRAKSWNEIFSTQEQRRQIEQDKEQVYKTLHQVALTGSQIKQSHQMISDELAHFQTMHPNQVTKAIRRFAFAQLKMERLKLAWLQRAHDNLMSDRIMQPKDDLSNAK